MNLFKYFGPSTLVTAAFIGPGTVAACTITGSKSGFSLLWVLIFAVFMTILFQEMAARLGLVTQEGLGEAMRKSSLSKFSKLLMIVISFSAIVIGNAAYEAGNISGAVMGLDLIWEGFQFWPLILGGLAALILYFGKYKVLEKILIALVLLMSICFLFTAIMLKPSLSDIGQGIIPNWSDFDNVGTIIALIGTTVVPYNLFLHASSISEKYKSVDRLKELRIENMVAIILGGIISITIVICSATVFSGNVEFTSVADFAKQLEPLLGANAKIVMAVGFFAAGLSSAITAPLAAAYAARGLFGLPKTFDNFYFRLTWFVIILIGVTVAMLGFKPVPVIVFAQIANGLLLPIIAGFLIYILNSKSIMGTHVNTKTQNIFSSLVLLMTIALAIKTMIKIFG